MKLLSKQEVNKGLKKQRDEIVEKTSRLHGYLTEGIKRLNNLKDDYGTDREKKLKEFEDFVKQINEKKSVLLKELKAYETLIEERKELYYALVEKADLLEERNRDIEIKTRKLEDRERFVIESETKLEAQWNSLLKKNA